jgi:signal transduction histidine kinase
MSGFAWGLATGLIAAAVVSVAGGVAVYRRQITLLRRMRQAERLAELGVLTGGLAHEIKNPLSTVQLNLQLLAEDLDRTHPLYDRLVTRMGTVQRETSRLREILDDFLRYAGKIELDRRPVDLNELLIELVDFFAPQAQLQRIQLRLDPGAGPVRADVDSKLIKQAVLNLMLNAMQAMPEGGEMILRAGRDDAGTTIDVIDTGPGIAPENVGKIFQAYYSTRRSGTGLGLAMTRRIVEEHGATIQVRSEVGKGSDFTLHFPDLKQMSEVLKRGN